MTEKSQLDKPRREGPTERPGAQGGKRDLNRKKRVDALKAAGLALFLDNGTDGVTIDDIARDAGTAKGNFYRYFESKADLVEAILEPMITVFREAGQEAEAALAGAKPGTDVTPAYRMFAQKLAMQAIVEPLPARLYLQEHNAAASPERVVMHDFDKLIRQTALSMTDAAMKSGMLDIGDPTVTSVAVIGAAEALMLGALKGDFPINPAQAVQQLVAMVLDGLRAK